MRAFAIFTRIDFPPFPVFYRNRGKEGVDCEQSEQDGAVQYNHNHTTRHPGVSGPAKLQNFVGDFGRDPVLRSAKLALFCFITQVDDKCRQLDTARPRYDEYGCFSNPVGDEMTPFGTRQPQFGYFPVILPRSTKILTKYIFILYYTQKQTKKIFVMKKILIILLCIFTCGASTGRSVSYNTNTHIYHEKNCPHVKQCTKNCITIDSHDAESRGGRPCKLSHR